MNESLKLFYTLGLFFDSKKASLQKNIFHLYSPG